MPYKGRNAFLETLDQEPGQELAGARLLPLALIDANPNQSRQGFDEQALADLAVSIGEHGVLEPILVRPLGERFQVVAGERRTRAARLAGLADIPAIIRILTDEQAAYVTAVENLQREDLDLEDEARWLAYLQELTGLSERQLAERLGKGRMWVNRRLRLLREHQDWFAQIREGTMTQRAAMEALVDPPVVSHGVTTMTDDSSQGDVSHGVTERAALDVPATPTSFRWRPAQQFATWLTKTRPQDVPADERATFRAQIAELRRQLDFWEAALEDEG